MMSFPPGSGWQRTSHSLTRKSTYKKIIRHSRQHPQWVTVPVCMKYPLPYYDMYFDDGNAICAVQILALHSTGNMIDFVEKRNEKAGANHICNTITVLRMQSTPAISGNPLMYSLHEVSPLSGSDCFYYVRKQALRRQSDVPPSCLNPHKTLFRICRTYSVTAILLPCYIQADLSILLTNDRSKLEKGVCTNHGRTE